MRSDPSTFEVALSFAGEQREYVGEVAAGLIELGIRVFYDEQQKVELWGKNQTEELQHVYQEGSATVVMFISREYEAKAWPSHERRSALSRAIRERGVYILPVRFDETVVPGLDPDMSYLRADEFTPRQLASAIVAKLEDSPADAESAQEPHPLLAAAEAGIDGSLKVDVTPEIYDQNNNGYKASIRIRNLGEPGRLRVAVKQIEGLDDPGAFAEWDAAWANAFPSAEREITTDDDSLALLATITVKRNRILITGLSCPLEAGSHVYMTHQELASRSTEPVIVTVRIAHLDVGRTATRSFKFGWDYPPDTQPVRSGQPILGAT